MRERDNIQVVQDVLTALSRGDVAARINLRY
jgi:ketosteroid isomerase-like protein